LTAGLCFVGSANEMVTLFLGLELISIPTYVMLYLGKADPAGQEAAIKYFLLSIFASALLLFGFSYLYGLTGTTNIAAFTDLMAEYRGPLPPLAIVAIAMIIAGLGFRIAAVPFHFYAPDVFHGTSTSAAAMLSFVPKVAGFVALVRLLGLAPHEYFVAGKLTTVELLNNLTADRFLATILWILPVVTMSLGNLLALLQDNIKRLLAYSGVAHAGYMLMGIAVAGALQNHGEAASRAGPQPLLSGIDTVLFYLVAYGAMTLGVFAALAAADSRQRPLETIDDLA